MKFLLVAISLVSALSSAAFADTYHCGKVKLLTAAHNITAEVNGERIVLGLTDQGSWVASIGETIYEYYHGTEDGTRFRVSTEDGTGHVTVISDDACQ